MPGDRLTVPGELPLRVTVERPDLCPLYCAALMDVRIGPSPAWLAERLTLSGVRSINNIVDVTNYVLLELNQPLHAFDYDTIDDRHLVVRTAVPGEALTTLDGVTRTLADDMLVIADAAAAQAVAGVMGGGATEIGPTTRTIALESAYFEPTQVRRTRRRLNLSTEASYRFERGVDPGMPVRALRRAVELIVQIGAGTPRDGEVIVGTPSPIARSVRLRWPRIARVLGMDVAPAEVEQILTSLGFHLRPIEDGGLRRTASSDGRTGSPLGSRRSTSRMGRDRARVARRRHARGRSDRGSRTLRGIRPPAGDVPRARCTTGEDRAAAGARRARP